MSDDIEFSVDQTASSLSEPSELAKKEQEKIEMALKPNSIVLKLWNGGHVSFEPESPVQIFAMLALITLSGTCMVVAIVGIFTPQEAMWPEKAFTVLGGAISAIVGAMVGSAATSVRQKRK